MRNIIPNIPLEKLTQLRREIHRYPEVSHKEAETAKRIKAFVNEYKPTKIIDNIGGHGLAVFFGENPKVKTIMVRSELDALPIKEINPFAHKSVYENISHKCGHDGHMAILCGLATLLSQKMPKNVNVILLFQPAEETGEGAQKVLGDKKWQNIKIDAAFALHNVPNFPLHSIVVKNKAFTPAVTSLIIELGGKTAHAAAPKTGKNPAIAVAEILTKAAALEHDEDDTNLTLITPVNVVLGEEAYGVSAGDAVLRFTLRAWTNEVLDRLKSAFLKEVEDIAQKHQLERNISETQYFASNNNAPNLVDVIRASANDNNFELIEKSLPFRWGEDFGLFTQQYTGAIFGLGSGENTPALHNPDYDFPDELIETGANMFYSIIKNLDK